MKGSIKASILSYIQLLDPSVNCCKKVRGEGSKSLIGIEILLYSCVPLLLGSSAVVSIAAPPQIAQAQVVPQAAINRPTLKVGSKGEPVSELQAALKLLGFYTGAVDGVYNETTASAVSQFKQAVGLNPDGVVDAATWQRLFPSEPPVASSVSSPSSASRFPVPSQTNNNNSVVVPSSNEPKPTTPTTTTNTRVVNPTNEPRPTTPTTTTTTGVVNPTNEPRPATPTTTTTTGVVNPTNEPRPATPTTTTNTRVVNPTNEPRPATPTTTASSRRTTVRQSSYARGSNTRTQQIARGSNTRTQQTTRPRSITRTQQISSIQYTPEGLPILRVGMRGSEVVRLQQRLRRLGFLEGDLDGDFGATTEAAVKAAQRRYGLEADGVVGGATWDILMRRRGS